MVATVEFTEAEFSEMLTKAEACGAAIWDGIRPYAPCNDKSFMGMLKELYDKGGCGDYSIALMLAWHKGYDRKQVAFMMEPLPSDSDDNLEVIHVYSREQAIADGVLVDVTDTAEWRESGIKYPVAVTAAVHSECVALTPAAEDMCNDVAGRLWDILFMFVLAARNSRGRDTITYRISVVRNRRRADKVWLKAVIAPGDKGEPVITIMYSNED